MTSLLDVLDKRARFAVEQRFGINDGRKRSYREVGEDLGVTAEAARRLVKRAVTTVRDQAEARTKLLAPPPLWRPRSCAAHTRNGLCAAHDDQQRLVA